MLRHWPFAVPVAYLLVILAVQPAGRQIPPGGTVPGYPLSGGYSRLITDDSDTGAWVLRAENAARGRKAGRPNEPVEWPKPKPAEMTHDTFWGAIYADPPPLSDRYFLEYPPAALDFFRLGLIGSGRPSNDVPINPALLDGHQYHVSHHAPATPTEERWYAAFRHAQRVYAAILLATLVAVMLLVRHGVGANGVARGPVWLLVLPGTLYFTPCRFDILPAALVLACVAATDRKRPLLGAALLGLAMALKTYPAVLAPLVLRYAARTWGGAAAWCLAFAVVPAAFALSLVLTDGPDAVLTPLAFQAKRDPHPEWVFYGRLFPTLFAFGDVYGQVFRGLPVLLVVGLFAVKRSQDADALLRRCAVAVILFVSLQVIFSPQWWIWSATLLVPLAGRRRWLIAAVAFGELLTYATFPLLFDTHAFDEIPDAVGVTLREVAVWLRAALSFGIAGLLVLEEGRPRPPVTAAPDASRG
jgi:hypothetical protein